MAGRLALWSSYLTAICMFLVFPHHPTSSLFLADQRPTPKLWIFLINPSISKRSQWLKSTFTVSFIPRSFFFDKRLKFFPHWAYLPWGSTKYQGRRHLGLRGHCWVVPLFCNRFSSTRCTGIFITICSFETGDNFDSWFYRSHVEQHQSFRDLGPVAEKWRDRQ